MKKRGTREGIKLFVKLRKMEGLGSFVAVESPLFLLLTSYSDNSQIFLARDSRSIPLGIAFQFSSATDVGVIHWTDCRLETAN